MHGTIPDLHGLINIFIIIYNIYNYNIYNI